MALYDQHCIREGCGCWAICPFSYQVSLLQVYSSPLGVEPEHLFLGSLLAPLPSLSVSALSSTVATSHVSYINSLQLKIKFLSSTSHISSAQSLRMACSYRTGWHRYRTLLPIITESSIGHQWYILRFSLYTLCTSTRLSFENTEVNKTTCCSQGAYGLWRRQIQNYAITVSSSGGDGGRDSKQRQQP